MGFYNVLLYSLDLSIAWALTALTIYSAYDLCVYLPFAPLITIALELVSMFLAWCIIYIPKLINSKIYPKNIQKKLSKADKNKLSRQITTVEPVEIKTQDNTLVNVSTHVNVCEYNMFSNEPRRIIASNVGSNISRDVAKKLYSSPTSDIIKSRSIDIESDSFSIPPSTADNRFLIRAYSDSGIEQYVPEPLNSITPLFESYTRYKKNAHKWTVFTHNYRTLANKAHASKDTVSHKLSILSDINLWIKMNILFPLVNNSVWVISDIIITVNWCLIWHWAASYMKREQGDISLLTWKFDDVPKYYWHLDAAFQCSAVLHYCIMLYYSNCKLRHIISFNGILELITTPCLSFILRNIYQSDSGHNGDDRYLWLMLVGSIRCLRILRTESLIYKSFYWLSEVKVIIVGVITDFLSLLLTFTSILFLLESHTHSNHFRRPFDFFYVGIVTIGTVGYGDFAPITTAGRLLVIIVIFTSFTMGSIQLKRLNDAMGSNSRSIGVLPTASDKYVVYWGPLFPNQLLAICRSLEASYEDCINFVVVLTNLPIEDYNNVYLAINKNSDIQICITGGSSKLITPSFVADLLLFSKMTVVVNELTVTHDNLLGHDDSVITIGDQDAILRYTTQLKIPLGLQISSDYYNSHLASMDFNNIICITDLTNAFLAKSVMCKGLFYLILSLYFIPHDMDRAKSYVEYCYNSMFALCETDEQQEETESSTNERVDTKMFSMLKGMRYQFFRVPFATCMRGLRFGELVRILHNYNGSVLVGVVQEDGTGFLCPWNYVIGQELEYQSEAFCGVVIANSIEEIIDMAYLEQLPGEYGYHHDQSARVESMAKSIKLETVKENINDSNDVIEDVSNDVKIEVKDYNEAVSHFKNSDPFIIVCGWPSSLHNFLTNVNVIVLAPNKRKLPSKMLGRVAYVKGTGLHIEDLIKAGILECYSLIILCCNHFTAEQTSAYNHYYSAKSERYSNLMSYDHQSIFIRNLACQILEKEKKTIDITSNKLIDNENCHIITEINQASSVEFFDVTFSTSVAALTSLGAAQKVWDNSSEFILSLQVTTGNKLDYLGTVFVKEMLYGLPAHSTSVCQYAIDPNYIYTLLGINWWHNRGNKQNLNMEQHIKHGMTSGHLSLVKIPKNMIGKPFRNLFSYMLLNKQSICIGIYRSYTIKSTKFSKGIIIAYPQNLKMQKQDEIYIAKPELQDYLF